MATGNYTDAVEGVWDQIYPREYNPESVRTIIREEIDLALRSPDISNLLIDGTVPSAKLRIPSGTALPISAADGDIFVYQGSDFAWVFQYHRTSEFWKFIGGPPSHAYVATTENRAINSYAALTTPGPTVNAPFFGDYIVSIGSTIAVGSGALTHGLHSFTVGTVAASDTWAASFVNSTNLHRASVAQTSRHDSVVGGSDITSVYKSATANSVDFSSRWMSVIPIRVRRTS